MTFGIVVFDQVEELDFIGPWEMLTMWSKYFKGPEQCLIVAQRAGPVTCAKGLSVNPHVAFEQCPTLDFLLVPGGSGTRREVDNSVMTRFVAEQARHCRAVLSVCTGSFVLQAAGLLAGRRAATHWGSLARLRELPEVTVVEERFVRDGPIWSAAGVSAGTDMMLAFIADQAGAAVAGQVQSAAEYYPLPIRYDDFDKSARAPGYLKRASD